MNRNRFRAALVCLVLAATALILFGCSSSDLSTLLGQGVFTATPKVAVVANFDTGTVASYTVNASTGALSEIAASPYTTPMTTAWGIAVHPNGKWVYVADDSTSKIEEFSVDNASGALTNIGEANDSNYVNSDSGMAVTQDGKWVVTADCNANLSVFAVNQTTGVLSSGTTFSPAAPPSCLNSVTVVNSKYVYAANYSSAAIWGFSINSSTGTLTELPGSPFTVAGTDTIEAQIADLTGAYLYTATDQGNIWGAKINSDGSLTPVATGFPVSSASGTIYQVAIDPRNKFLYAPNNGSKIAGFAINASTGALTAVPGSPFDTGGSQVQNVVTDPSGMFVYGSNWKTSNTTAGFSINQSTGVLTPVPGSPFANKGTSCNSMVITH